MRIDTKRKLALRVLSTAALMAMVSSIATAAFADTYYMENGSISIVAKENGNYITQGEIKDHKDEGETVITNQDSSTASKNTVTIKAEEDSTAKVTLKDVNIDVSDSRKAAMTVTGTGDTEIELKGDNTLVSGSGHAGLEKSDTYGSEPSQNGSLTINAKDTNSSLTATGGTRGAGIGGANYRSGSNITINNGTIVANGGAGAAGIGGGSASASTDSINNGSNITITGGNITATAGSNTGKDRVNCGAGIGGGAFGEGNNITISGGTVNATGGEGNDSYAFGGAGIGGGYNRGANTVTISGDDTKVTATGKDGGAGIGGGFAGTANKITIAGGTVDATGGSYGAGIGGGGNNYYSEGGNASNITISGDKTHVTATGGADGSGIGGGAGGGCGGGFHPAGSVNGVTISGGTVIATGNGSAAGIGGGSDVFGETVAGSATDITISGGNVTAIGGKGSDSRSGGAGIGGGTDVRGKCNGGVGSNITISGGAVNAVGGRNSAGIGGGDGAGCSGITISGGTVKASSEDGAAGIGGGRLAGAGTADSTGVTITNGTVTANGGAGAAGIGDGYNNVSDVGSVISITGGTVAATGGAGEAAGIGNGEKDAHDATVNISATNAVLDVTAVTQGSGEAITGGEDLTMAKLNNRFSGVVRFFRGEDHYNTVHNGKYVGMDDNNADEHKETDAHIWGSTEIIRQATPTEQGILRHHCAVDGCKGYYEEFFDYVAPAEPVTPAPTDPDTPDVPGTPDVTPDAPAQTTPAQSTPAQDTPADAAVTPDATTAQTTATASGEQQITANAALPKTGANWLAVLGTALSGLWLMAVGFVLDRRNRRQD